MLCVWEGHTLWPPLSITATLSNHKKESHIVCLEWSCCSVMQYEQQFEKDVLEVIHWASTNTIRNYQSTSDTTARTGSDVATDTVKQSCVRNEYVTVVSVSCLELC